MQGKAREENEGVGQGMEEQIRGVTGRVGKGRERNLREQQGRDGYGEELKDK